MAAVRGGLRRGLDGIFGALEPAAAAGSVVALCHCHDPDLVGDLAAAVGRLPRGSEVHATTSRAAVARAWEMARPGLRPSLTVHRVENRGRDVRPFFEIARRLGPRPDAAVLKIHGKRSPYTPHGDRWRRDLIDGLVPNVGAARRVVARFAREPRLALLGAPGSYIGHPVYWGEDGDGVRRWMACLSQAPVADDELGFFAGTMFWIRGAFLRALLPFVDLDAFEPEPLPQDGAYPHTIERVIAMAARRTGWEVGEIGRAGSLDPAHVRDRKLIYI